MTYVIRAPSRRDVTVITTKGTGRPSAPLPLERGVGATPASPNPGGAHAPGIGYGAIGSGLGLCGLPPTGVGMTWPESGWAGSTHRSWVDPVRFDV
jgi:hypothetical protein